MIDSAQIFMGTGIRTDEREQPGDIIDTHNAHLMDVEQGSWTSFPDMTEPRYKVSQM